ncbi:hypothetical protein HDU97_009208 [Phlyctochytrium planicorne]|nr:hypothetical protein HDU97_009208 [Phlyctochytrium planicorne]
MMKKKEQRRRQSTADREHNMDKVGKELANPFEEYRRMLREQSLRDSEALMPSSLFNLTSYLFVSIILNGRSDTPEAKSTMTFILKMLGKTSVSWSTYLLALFYSRRFVAQATPGDHLPLTAVYASSIICADKFLYDATYSNQGMASFLSSPNTFFSQTPYIFLTLPLYPYIGTEPTDWSSFTRIPLHQLNLYERRFLKVLNYNLSDEGFDLFISHLDLSLMLRQIGLWGFPASYMDIIRIVNFLQSPPPTSASIAKIFSSSMGFKDLETSGLWWTSRSNPSTLQQPRLPPLAIAQMLYAIILRSLMIYVLAAACAISLTALVVANLINNSSTTALIALTAPPPS